MKTNKTNRAKLSLDKRSIAVLTNEQKSLLAGGVIPPTIRDTMLCIPPTATQVI